MARIRTQEDFIAKAKEVHGDYYDYGLVEYHKTNEKVAIICPIHGVFYQSPHHHLSGQGCKICGRERTKTGLDEFLRRAHDVHGDRYDYSKAVYVSSSTKVCIICREHGEFWQTPHCHIVLKQNCPKCSAIEGGSKRTGDNNSMRRESVKKKAQQTCLERYGTKTYAESEEGRQKLHDIITQPELQERSRQTCMDRYGAPVWTQSDEGKQALHELMSSDEMQQRVKQGYIDKYGIDHYMKSDEGREKARINISDPERQQKIRQAFHDKYGVNSAFEVPEFVEKFKQTMLRLYGVTDVYQSAELREKGWVTKRQNGTYNTSKPEETLYGLLCDVFGKDDVIRQYFDKDRYPFHCDFYVKPIDTFIELNASWTHGSHWFDETNSEDLELLSEWKRLAEQKGSRYYHSAIHVWTNRDLQKRDIAAKNHINYIVFWNNDLADARAWLEQYR